MLWILPLRSQNLFCSCQRLVFHFHISFLRVQLGLKISKWFVQWFGKHRPLKFFMTHIGLITPYGPEICYACIFWSTAPIFLKFSTLIELAESWYESEKQASGMSRKILTPKSYNWKYNKTGYFYNVMNFTC